MTLRSAIVRLLALAIGFPLAAHPQFTVQNDPANLAGERVSAPDLADTLPLNHGTPALEQLLRELRTRASFMLIVAHPDDEDNGMLTYLSRGQGARVATLTLTRGEGGQNLMSADFEDALGLIRTQELLAADRYMGVDQFFGTEVDFGFSKTKEEAFAKWTHERVLYDAVRAIRLYRPLVIGAVFIGAPSDGHGQHQVSGEIAQEAFKAAGDPNVFPDQIAAGLLPWQPLKVYARIPFARIDEQGMFDYATNQYVKPQFTNYVTGKVTTTVPKANVVIHEGDTDPLLGGKSYAQFGREGRALQRSQIGGGGGGQGGRGGRADVRYHRYGSMLHQADGDDGDVEPGFFEGIDTSLAGIASLAPEVSDKLRPELQRLDDKLAKAQHDFDPAKPEAIAQDLRDTLAAFDQLIAELQNSAVNDIPQSESFNLLHELKIKRVQLNNALATSAGLSLTASLEAPKTDVLSDQKSVTIELKVSNHSAQDVRLKALSFNAAGVQIPADETRTIAAQATWHGERAIEKSDGFVPTRPYFYRKDIEQPYYDLSAADLRNAPATPAPLSVRAQLDYEGVPVILQATVAGARATSPTQPAMIVPPVSVALSRNTQILATARNHFDTAIYVRPSTVPPTSISLKGPETWRGEI
ncbi:MAG TPA: PIG-L family deacetylase, partial [Acidobacteriaceae bacterium]|nr:PIG-L family deacetylase [Acidobacteriaceae bacterium]